jgi:hypothetical protein
MMPDDIDQLRQLAEWHERQARYLLLTVTSGQHDGGRFHNAAAARLLRLVSQIEKKPRSRTPTRANSKVQIRTITKH